MFNLEPELDLSNLEPPEVIEVIRKNQPQTVIPPELEDEKIAVVAVIGSGITNYTGFKRAFRLAIDAFGNVRILGKKSKQQERSSRDNEETEKSEEILQVVENVGSEDQQVETGDGVWNTDEEKVDKDQTKPSKVKAAPTINDDKNRDLLLNTCEIDAFFAKSEAILFLNLSGADDPLKLLDAAEELQQSIQKSGLLPVWSTMKSIYCRYLLLIFSLSHVIFFSESRSSFNTNYLHLFRILDSVRLLIKPTMSKVLEKVGTLTKDWSYHARICSPRMLFLFEVDPGSSAYDLTAKNFHFGESDKKQAQLESQIYNIFRKCRLVTNISANSLFAIPSEEDYIFLFDKTAEKVSCLDTSPQEIYKETIAQACNMETTGDNLLTSLFPTCKSASGTSIQYLSGASLQGQSLYPVSYHTILNQFKEFILHHTRMALEKGFDDDSRRVAEHKHFFVVPTLGEWKIGFQILYDVLLNPGNKMKRVTEGFDKLMRYINVDSEYLHSQCSTIFPKIFAVYQRGLPEFYSEHTHRRRLTHAMNAYLTISRGHGILPWLNKLAEKCEQYWRRGRQQCEILSLFNHPCVNPLHRVPPDDSLEIYPAPELDSSLQEMKHNAGGRINSHCNCGRKEGYRDEPFTIREANFGFYQRIGKDCCDRLECIQFPVFTPTAKSELSLEDMLKILKLKSDAQQNDLNNKVCVEDKHSYASQLMEIDLRQDENEMGDECDDPSDVSQESQEMNEVSEEIQNDSTSKYDDSESASTAGTLVFENAEQASHNYSDQSEYLPGMIHSKSPIGLLPKFSSWSLLRLGMSSLYNHSSGISPRTGFLSGTHYLLPWDVQVKAEAGVSKPVPRIIRGRRHSTKPKPISDEFNVKVFFGYEYECHRGHRFMANDVDKIVNFNIGNVGLRESAAKIAGSDLPLYFNCPCKESRDGRTMIAQLLRVHIVTPKAPVHCMIFPKVQPASSPCPVFTPGISDPVKLAPSSYWVLRLPYCYVGDHQIYSPTTDDRSNSKLLKELISVKSMTKAETKLWENDNL
ncbi:protein SMG8 isoform X1 [Folsomia candida]|uniref:protein SMG8 isoform X1 n=1 Tax=Folsomia candida TaxID=158441 RepID=UPI000B8F91E7|nr:protein SMG8 isoform X1 [Folsomia candida]